MSRERKTFMRRSAFTLFEILIAIALLVVLSGVLLRVFVLVGDYWTTSEEQARLYADAKTALAILSEDLSNALYSPPSASSTDKDAVAPMWLEACRYYEDGEKAESKNISVFDDILSPYNSGQYGPWLHLVTRTMWGEDTHPHGEKGCKVMSDVRKVCYLFMPPSKTGESRDAGDLGGNFSGDGELARICRSDYENSCSIALGWRGGVDMASEANTESTAYFPITATIMSECKRTVATGVLDFRVYAYRQSKSRPVALMTSGGATKSQSGVTDDTDGTSLRYGMTGVKRIQVVLTLIPPGRLAELRKLTDANKQKDYIYKHARTFRKTIRIKEMKEEVE